MWGVMTDEMVNYFRMAPRKMRESAQLVVLQFDLLPAFLFQIHRIIIAYQLYEAGWNMILVAFVCLRKSKNRNKKGFHCSSV